MSDVEGMIRLMHHAADRLSGDEAAVRSTFFHQCERANTATERAQAMNAQASSIAGMVYAQTMLRMVAACMTVDSPSED